MKISIIGGTGGMGEGLAMRWSVKHNVIVGSRDANRAKDSAANYSKIVLEAFGSRISGSIKGDENVSAANECDVLILSIPYETIDDTCGKLSQVLNERCIVVSPIVPMRKSSEGFEYIPIKENAPSAAEKVASRMPPRGRIVSALHTISEVKLKHLSESLDCDAFVCGDDPNHVTTVSNLISEVPGLRPLNLGPLALSYQAEMMTPFLLNAAKVNKIKHPGLKIV